ncbi:MAG: hypothetical protein U1F47_05705 [Hyphomicrobiales bacterium]
MNSTAHRSFATPGLSLDLLGRVQGWISARLNARRAQRDTDEAIAYLRTLDAHLLDDMGVDMARLGSVTPTLVSAHPLVIVPDVIGTSKTARGR